MKQIIGALFALALTGCACVTVSDAQRAEIDALHSKGISWSKNPPPGFKPVVKMGPAVCWAILPGAGQIFIADKIGDAHQEGRISELRSDCNDLNGDGVVMLAVSWFPLIYDVTHPFGTGGVIQDVNRVNNLALLEFMKSQKR